MDAGRIAFFATTLNLLAAAAQRSQTDFATTASHVADQVSAYALPEPTAQSFSIQMLDDFSRALLPQDGPENFLPLKTTSNGNCLYNAVSLALVGNEHMATELRVRTTLCLLQLKEYLVDSNNDMVSNLIKEQIILYSAYARTDYKLQSKPTTEQLLMVYENEILSTVTNYSWSSMYQIQALGTCLNMAIWSVYPQYNTKIRSHFNKLISPLLPHEGNLHIIPILWTGPINDRLQFTANHFVPLIDSTRFSLQNSLPEIMQFTTGKRKKSFINTHVEQNSNQTCTNNESSSKPSARCMLTENQQYTSNNKQQLSCYSLLPHHYCCTCHQLLLAQRPKKSNIASDTKYYCSLCFKAFQQNTTSSIDKDTIGPGDIPIELQCLTTTEVHMVSLIHPYMTLLKLPSGGQYCQKGQSINIPVPVDEICYNLPTSQTNSLVVVRSHKEGSNPHTINANKLHAALIWLKSNNPLYEDITVSFATPTTQQNDSIPSEEENIDNVQDLSFVQNDYVIPTDKKPSLALQQHPNYTLPILTGRPINTFQHPKAEELAFPQLYPFGVNGYATLKKLATLKQYFSVRLLNKDSRWASCIPYLFWALNIYEQHQLQSCISIAMRIKAQSTQHLQVQHILNNQYDKYVAEDFKFMKAMKGTASYWREQLFNLLAKMRTLGPPTFFISLSCNDSNWLELYKFIDPSLHDEDLIQLTSTQKSHMIRVNPIKCALYFTRRWETFLKQHILGPQKPLGEVSDYFARIEFQNRGSPHIHAFLWIKGAPDMETIEGRKHGVNFINKYITAQLPPESDKLHSAVKKLQTHTHTTTCYKRNARQQCRFDFPREVSQTTQINISNLSATTGRFYKLARSPDSVWINPYNPTILQLWNANIDIQIVGCKNAAAAYVCTYVCKNEPESLKAALSQTLKTLPHDATMRKRLSKVGNILLTHRLISAQEAAYRILNIPMVYSSRDTIFINSAMPEKQYKILKPKYTLESLPTDSTDIFAQSLYDLYVRRPNTMLFNNMCLVEFATKYTLLNSREKVNARSHLKRFCLQGSPKQHIREKRHESCFRTYTPQLAKDEEGYFHSLLYLFIPWRQHTDINLPFSTYKEAYAQKQHLLDQTCIERFSYSKKIEAAVQHIRSMVQDEQEDIQCPITPAFMSLQVDNDITTAQPLQSVFSIKDHSDIGDMTDSTKSSYTDDEFKCLAQYTMTDEEYNNKLSSCTPEQTNILNLVDTYTASPSTSPLHLYISGGAGCGKSYVLQILREHLLRKNTKTYPNVIVGASTGVAAYNIKAWTLHRLLHLDVQHKNQATYLPLSAKQLTKMRKLFSEIEVLIIDEISMVSVNTLLHIHKRLSEIKDTKDNPDIVFGNLHIIVFGDLYQLRPVYGGRIFKHHKDMPILHLWKDLFWFIELTINVRQNTDQQYAAMLNRIRDGNQTKNDLLLLEANMKRNKNHKHNVQHIYPTKKQCATHNEKEIQSVTGNLNTICTLKAIDDPPNTEIDEDDTFCGGLNKTLKVCVGVKVMLLRNINTSVGLVNGAQGKITKITWQNHGYQTYHGQLPQSIDVLFDDPTIGTMFTETEHQPITIKPMSITFYNKNRVRVTRTQFPLSVSYGVTVHKIQGLTLEEAAIDIGTTVFTAGMAYVALSRVSTMNGLKILDLHPNSIYASTSVTEEMRRLRKTRSISCNNRKNTMTT